MVEKIGEKKMKVKKTNSSQKMSPKNATTALSNPSQQSETTTTTSIFNEWSRLLDSMEQLNQKLVYLDSSLSPLLLKLQTYYKQHH